MFKRKYSICLSAEMHHKQNQTINEHPLCSTVPTVVPFNRLQFFADKRCPY